MEEIREHTIKDILSREYSAGTFSILPGGNEEDLVYSIKPLDFLLTQPNFLDKIRGFAFLRADAEVRFQYTTLPTNTGGIITSYIADVGDAALVSRRTTLNLQMSQLPTIQTTLTSATPLRIAAKWISPYYARNLTQPVSVRTGNLGTVIMKRLTPSSGLAINFEVYVSLIPGTVHLAWPTPFGPPIPRQMIVEHFHEAADLMTESELKHNIRAILTKYENALPASHVGVNNSPSEVVESNGFVGIPEALPMSTKSINMSQVMDKANGLMFHMKSERVNAKPKSSSTESGRIESKGKISGLLETGSKVANMISHVPVVGGVASTVAPFLKLGSGLLSMFGLSKPVSEKPVRHIKFKPADDHLTMEGILPTHEFGITRENGVDSSYSPYGSKIDETSVEGIMNVPNIIGSFRVTSATPRRTVLFTAPLNLCQYVLRGNSLYPTHQFLISNLFNQWLADLKFDVDIYLSMFHKVQLRFIVLPGVRSELTVGQPLPAAIDINKCQSMIVEYGGDNVNASISIGPRSDTAFRFCPQASVAGGANNLLTLQTSRLDSETSYGVFAILVEVPMTNSATVASTVDGIVSFSASNVKLGVPRASINMAPVEHGMKAEGVLDTDFFKLTRSERLVGGAESLKDSSAARNTDNQLALCVGEKFQHLRQFLNGYTKFHDGIIPLNIGVGIAIEPGIRRIYANGNTNIDHFDYLTSIFGFHKGKMHLRIAETGPPGTVGNSMLITQTDNTTGLIPLLSQQVLTRSGFATGNIGYATSGTRTIPTQSEESVPDFSTPYYQSSHIIRSHFATQSQPSAPGEENIIRMVLGSMQNQILEIFRCTGDDFTMGFLMSVPKFTLVNKGFST
nr:MAG: capsid protein [Chemarfal virus 273]